MAQLTSAARPGDIALRKSIRLRHAVALYMTSVLGSGVLVLPGLAAQIAGPGSLVAWCVLSFASYPFAYTFASLSARRPESGGVYAFARESFGPRIATVAGWLFALWYISGAPAVTLIAASYISYAVPMGRGESYIIAASVIVLAFLVNYRGMKFTNRTQIAVVGAIVALLVAVVASSIGSVRAENFAPFTPHGLLPIGTAAALIFWSFLGYENVSNIAEEFENPERDFRRSIRLSVFLIGLLYCAVAVVTVGTGAYLEGGSVAPFAAIFSNVIGRYAAIGTAALALFIIFGTANAYTAGMSRVIYAVARDGGLPRLLAHLSPRTGVPDRSLIMLFAFSLVMLSLYFFSGIGLEKAMLIPSGAAILVYVIGSASGIKLLVGRGRERGFAVISLLLSVSILPFVGTLALVSVLVASAGLCYIWLRERAG
ncbi:MAG TPA: amino acid permease [Bacteroidota bacterium]|nr:amino acid permease [Bacteroidota bacterium]